MFLKLHTFSSTIIHSDYFLIKVVDSLICYFIPLEELATETKQHVIICLGTNDLICIYTTQYIKQVLLRSSLGAIASKFLKLNNIFFHANHISKINKKKKKVSNSNKINQTRQDKQIKITQTKTILVKYQYYSNYLHQHLLLSLLHHLSSYDSLVYDS